MVRIQERDNNKTLRKEVTTTFHRTRMIRPHISESEDSDLEQTTQAMWYLPNTQSGQSTSTAQTVSPGKKRTIDINCFNSSIKNSLILGTGWLRKEYRTPLCSNGVRGYFGDTKPETTRSIHFRRRSRSGTNRRS